jgi:flagellar basal-body rod modification protein FlgD
MADSLISALSAATSTTTGGTAVGSTMGKEDFLRLLTTQLRYQDPLAPEDPKDFVAQLAQFSSLEQQINTNNNLESLAAALKDLQNSQTLAQGVNLLGKTVKGSGNTLTVTGGQALGAGYELPQAAAAVTAGIYNSSGTLVRTLDLGAQAAGSRQLTWDGKDSQGRTVADGTYTYKISAKDKNGNSLPVSNYFTGQVEEIYQDSQGIWLLVNGRPVLLSNVVAVTDGS